MKAKGIIEEVAHRPWDLPQGKWRYYQEWNRSLFLHWKMPTHIIQPLIPGGLTLDRFDQEAWVSLVAFTMEKIRPRGLPAVPVISNFHELNLRTYVTKDGKPGVFFLHISAQKAFSAWLAKKLSGLPYQKAEIGEKQYGASKTYSSVTQKKELKLNVEFSLGGDVTTKSALDKWLTERYCLYLDRGDRLCRYDIHHAEWNLRSIDLSRLTIDSTLGEFAFDRYPDLMHYSEGVKVLAWGKQMIN